MAEQIVTIGGRDYEVACQDGEEAFLLTAARLLDAEAQGVLEQIGRLPEVRVLLMAGLMLADKAAGSDHRVERAEARAAALEAELAELRAATPTAPARVEVPVVPADLAEKLAELAERSELLAAEVERKHGGT